MTKAGLRQSITYNQKQVEKYRLIHRHTRLIDNHDYHQLYIKMDKACQELLKLEI